MHNLKTFESFAELGYERVSSGKASNAFQDRGGADKINNDEYDQMVATINRIGGRDIRRNVSSVTYISSFFNAVVVNKGKDEYYYIMDDSTIPGTWYECDGIDGLIKCLRSL